MPNNEREKRVKKKGNRTIESILFVSCFFLSSPFFFFSVTDEDGSWLENRATRKKNKWRLEKAGLKNLWRQEDVRRSAGIATSFPSGMLARQASLGNALWDIEFRFLLFALCHWIYQLRDSNWPRETIS